MVIFVNYKSRISTNNMYDAQIFQIKLFFSHLKFTWVAVAKDNFKRVRIKKM